MKKDIFVIMTGAMLLLSFCVSGCQITNKKTTTSHRSTTQYETVSKTSPLESKSSSVKTFLQQEVKDKQLIAVKNVEKNIIMLVLEKNTQQECCFFSIAQNKVVSRWENVEIVGDIRIQRREQGFVVYSSTANVYIGNERCEMEESIEIPEICADNTSQSGYCILPEQKKIIYYTEELDREDVYIGVYETDYKGKKKKLRYKINGPETNTGKLNSLERICPSYDEATIFFTGGYYTSADSGAEMQYCVGRIRLSDWDISIKREEKQEMLVYGDTAVFYDGMQEKGKSTGQIFVMNQEGKVRSFCTNKKEESQSIVLADSADYYATCYEKNDTAKISYVSFYDCNTCEKQFCVKVPEKLLTFCVFEKKQTIIGMAYDEDSQSIEPVIYQYKDGGTQK